MRTFGLALLITLAGACSSTDAPKGATSSDRASEELNILASVFRYQFEHNGAAYLHPDRYFLSLSEAKDPPKDPSPELLARFKGADPPVEPLSAADTNMWFGVHLKGKKGRGVLLRLTEIRWIDDDTVEVDGGYHESSLNASGNTYRAERRNGEWTVVKDTMHWIS